MRCDQRLDDRRPLDTGRVDALSLEYHLALEMMCTGHGSEEWAGYLLRMVWLAYYMREPGIIATSVFNDAGEALASSLDRGERGDGWFLTDAERAPVTRVLTLHDDQLARMPRKRFYRACERLQKEAAVELARRSSQ